MTLQSLGSYRRRSLLFGVALLVAFIAVLLLRPTVRKISGETMGTTYSIVYLSAPLSNSAADVSKGVERILSDVNDSMSTYIPESELMRFNRSPIGKPFSATPELIELIEQSQAISRMSNGAYDVTVGPLVNLWGFGPKQSSTGDETGKRMVKKSPEFIEWAVDALQARVPEQSEVELARSRVDYTAVVTDRARGELTRTIDLFVDLSSIAKGYAVDRLASHLELLGISSYMVEIGGEIRVGASMADDRPWRLGIRGPSLSAEQPVTILSLENSAVATSGDYLNYFEYEGQRYSHTIDPRSGYPEKLRLAEVTVVDDSAARADALATLFMVIGDREGLALANREGIAAWFTYHSGEGFESVASEAFQPYLKE